MSDVGAVGEAVTGAAVARAVEPAAGEASGGHAREENCLNCGCKLVGSYCHCCGQHAHVHRTIGAWWHDFLHSVLHLDGKFWRTLPMLAWHPGELTRRYAHGERAKFISPLALFLFTVFLMFAVFSLLGGPFDGTTDTAGLQRGLEQETRSLRDRASALELERRQLEAAGSATQSVDAQLQDVNDELRSIEAARNIVLVPNSAPQGAARTIDLRSGVDTGWAWLDGAIEKARANPDLLLYKIQANAYKFSWALIPISVPFLWVLFLHRRRHRASFTLYDHLVFVTYSIAFMSLWLIAWALVTALGFGGFVDLAMILLPPLHMYRQLKGAYRLSRFSALWRTFVLLIFATIALMLFGLLLLMLGVQA